MDNDGDSLTTHDALAEAQARIAALETLLSDLRHDLRGILSPTLLVSDRLLSHSDIAVRRTGERVVATVERAVARLAEAKLPK